MFRSRAEAPISPTMRSPGTAGIQIPPGPCMAVWSGFDGPVIPTLRIIVPRSDSPGRKMMSAVVTYLPPTVITCPIIWARKCRTNVQFPFLSSYNRIRIPDTSHCGIWYTTRAVVSKQRRNSMSGFAMMGVIVQKRTSSPPSERQVIYLLNEL